MKRTLTLIVLLATLLHGTIPVFAQTMGVEFTYDDSGNRSTRQIVNLKTPDITQVDTTDKKFEQGYKHQVTGYTEIIADYEVTIFPNPTSGMFKVVISNTDIIPKASLLLHTISGTLIYQKREINSVTQIDIQNKENGAYILTVIIAGKKKTWKIIKN